MPLFKKEKTRMTKLGELPIKKLFWSYAIPSIIASTSTSLYNVIDRIFIGHGVGPYAISGLALTLPLMNIAVAFSTLIGTGASSIISIRLGEKREDLAFKTLGNATLLFILIGFIFSALSLIYLDPILRAFGASDQTLPYAKDFMQIILCGNILSYLFYGYYNVLRASGYPNKAMRGMILSVLLNLALAPLFIFVFQWGIQGAALATLMAQFLGLLIFFNHLISKNHIVHFTKNSFQLSKEIISKIFSIGLSPFVVHICAFLVVTVVNLQLKKYGGDFAIGAAGIINSIAGLVIMIIFGFAQGMQPIIGYNYGAKLYQRMWEAYRITVLWASITGIVSWVFALTFPYAIAQVFTNDQELIEQTAHGLRLYFLAFPLIGFQLITSHFFLSIGKAKISIFLSLFRQVIILLPILLIFSPIWRVNGVWLSEPISSSISMVLAVYIMYRWYSKQTWKSVRF